MNLLLEAVASHRGAVDSLAAGNLRADLIAIGIRSAGLLASEPIGSVTASLILESRRDRSLDASRKRFVSQRRQAAHLGFPGMHGLLITPEHGPTVRLAAVFTSVEDLPLPKGDNPHAWVGEYCDHCGLCVRRRPVDAIHAEQRAAG